MLRVLALTAQAAGIDDVGSVVEVESGPPTQVRVEFRERIGPVLEDDTTGSTRLTRTASAGYTGRSTTPSVEIP